MATDREILQYIVTQFDLIDMDGMTRLEKNIALRLVREGYGIIYEYKSGRGIFHRVPKQDASSSGGVRKKQQLEV